MERREFIRSTCLGCAGLAVGSIALSACSAPMPLVKLDTRTNPLRVPLSSFGAASQVLVRASRLPQDILLVRRPDGAFAAIYLLCTHRDQPITVTITELHCPSHGSRFGPDGSVLEGPATRPLRRFAVTTEGSDLLIDLEQNSPRNDEH